jgi:hypothetical protein
MVAQVGGKDGAGFSQPTGDPMPVDGGAEEAVKQKKGLAVRRSGGVFANGEFHGSHVASSVQASSIGYGLRPFLDNASSPRRP